MLRDIIAELMSEICHNVGTEPTLQPIITDERLVHHTANREDGARLEVATDSFWNNDGQRTFFDIRAFSTHERSYQNISFWPNANEQEKKRAYDLRVKEIEHGTSYIGVGSNHKVGGGGAGGRCPRTRATALRDTRVMRACAL